MSVRHVSGLVLALVAGVAIAADHPVAGDKLLLKDPVETIKRKVRFKAATDPAIDPAAAPAPTSVGATIEVFGSGPGDGVSGPRTLPAGLWSGLGSPAGTKGYRFLDPMRANGIKKVLFKTGATGGTLVVAGGGSAWPYGVTQPQSGVEVRFSVGPEVYCAAFTSFVVNQPGKVVARLATAPAGCTAPPSTTTSSTTSSSTTTTVPTNCGDGVATFPEECDDGGTASGDGCSATCLLESTAGLCQGVASTSGTALDAVRVATGIFQPTHITAPPLDPYRVFVAQQDGYVRIIQNGTLLGGSFLDIHDEVGCCGEQGLLGIAFHPNYEQNGRFYVSYTAPSSGSSSCAARGAGDNVIAQYTVSGGDPNQIDESTRVELLRIPQAFSNHNGGQIAFGPGGYLYFGVGDGGSGGDPCESGQNDADPLGKLYRIDPDNPPAAPLDAVWAKGVRNPWRWSFDRGTGDFYLADVGQNLWEEVDVVPAPVAAGLNYGWDVYEARHCFEPMTGCSLPGAQVPVLEYCHFQSDPACGSHPRGCSITGGFVYRGCALPDLHGRYFYSDFCGAWLRSFQGVSGGDAQSLLDHTSDVNPTIGGFTINDVTSFGEDARGELYIADQGGDIFKLVPES